MYKQVNDIRRDVRVAIDHNAADSQWAGDMDVLTLDQIIDSKVEQGVRIVMLAAPAHNLDGLQPFAGALYDEHNNPTNVNAIHWFGDSGCGWILLCEGFLRLVVFEMSDWERPVYTAISASDAQYAMQRSRYGGIRGNWQNPVCALVPTANGLALEFYGCRSQNADVSQAVCVLERKVQDGQIEIPGKLYDASVYMIAALVLRTLGDNDKAAVMEQLATTMWN